MKTYQPGWVDLAIVAILILGMVRGRKRGMSEEMLDVLKWVLIVVVGSALYGPIGQFFCDLTPFSLLSCYIAVYTLVVLSIFGLFSMIKRAVGTKIVESDCFGEGEYYLGIFAGAFRYACIVLVGLSLLHARYYSPGEVSTKRETQLNDFGMVLFTFSGVQAAIFQHSFLGGLAEEYLDPLMIRPTSPTDKRLGNNRSGVRARERSVYEILE